MIKLFHNESAGRMLRAMIVVVSCGADKPVAAVKQFLLPMTFVRHGFDESSVSGSNMSKGSS